MSNSTELAVPTIMLPSLVPGAGALQLGFEMPRMLMSLLERRYLTEFQPSSWSLGLPPDDGGRPLLREVQGIGRGRPGEDWTQAMPHVLTAAHALGQATVMVLRGEGARHRIHLGGRRLTRRAQGSTEDFVEGQGSVLQANLPGLELGLATRTDTPAMSGLAEFLRAAPAVAVVTGVPSPRGGLRSAVFQNIDRLVAAAGTRRYALMVVAEPLEPADLDHTVDNCRRLKTEIHAMVRRTVTRGVGESSSSSESKADSRSALKELAIPGALYGLAAFCSVAGATFAPGVGGLASPAMFAAAMSRGLVVSPPVTATTGTGTSTSESGSAELLDANAEACEALLDQHIRRLEAARSNGWWLTSVYVFAESDGALEAVTGALRGIASGEASTLDPVRVVRVDPHLVRSAALRGQTIGLVPTSGGVRHPLGPAFDALATCLTSDELSVLLAPPAREIPGLPRREAAEFALSAPAPTDTSIVLGALQDGVGRQLGPVSLTSQSLNRHVLITGMTGYGKSTTAKRLLVEAATTLGLPFLVIEPVKAEYRRLATEGPLRGRVAVYAIGDEPGTLPLRLNPFVPVDSVPLLRHIDLLKAVFNASFPMFAGMSYVLEEAMLEAYTDRGWNLHSSVNDLLGAHPSEEDRSALVPSIADLHDKVEKVLSSKQYAREVHQNMGAALRSRLRSLMVGAKGATLASARSVPARDLFSQPCVIELRNLGDEEKAFVMALLLCQLYEFAESRMTAGSGAGENLQHLTLIEEAHRLLRAGRAAGAETADAQAKAVAMFTDMLAEMRSYGEGFVVADQIPTKLAPEILKNSNVKILHRLVAPDDRAVAAASANLDDSQARQLGNLQPGTAIVHDDRNSAAVLVRMEPLSDADRAPLPADTPTRVPEMTYLHRNSGCRSCPAPCTFLEPGRRISSEDALDAALAPIFSVVLAGGAVTAWSAFTEWRTRWMTDAQTRVPSVANAGGLSCAFTQSAHRWLGRRLAERAEVTGATGTEGSSLLVQSRCARLASRLSATWREVEVASAAELPDAAAQAFTATHQGWAEALHTPPREMPGCPDCPSRCTTFGAVSELPRRRATPSLPGPQPTCPRGCSPAA